MTLMTMTHMTTLHPVVRFSAKTSCVVDMSLTFLNANVYGVSKVFLIFAAIFFLFILTNEL